MATPSWQVAGNTTKPAVAILSVPAFRGSWRSCRPKGSARLQWRFRSNAAVTARFPSTGSASSFSYGRLRRWARETGRSVSSRTRRRTPSSTPPSPRSRAGPRAGPWLPCQRWLAKFLGVESAPIRFDRTGAKWSVTAANLVDMAAEGAMGINPSITEPIYLDNTGHPAANRFALAHALKSHVEALGVSWNDTSGKNHGQYAPFSWRSA